MNRILRRPMFRIGGSAGTGITSGLDRKGYKEGPTDDDRVRTDAQRIFDLTQDLRKANQIRENRLGPGTLPGFLTSLGINLASATPRGNIIATAAESAKDPFERFQAAQLTDAARKRADVSDDISGAVSGALSLEEERLENVAGGGDDQFKFEAEIVALEKYTKANNTLQDENTKLSNRKNELQAALQNPNVNTATVTKEISDIDNAILQNNRSISSNNLVLNQIKGTDQIKIAEAAAIIESFGVDSEEYAEFKKSGRIPSVPKADGGRIGYANGTPMMPKVAENIEDTGEVQDLSYNELRSRLPSSIENNIVQLLANSKQALLEFANIRDQSDVQEFNQKYSVNLALAQEG